MAKEKRLTDELNIALAKAETAISIAKQKGAHQAESLVIAEKAVQDAFAIMIRIKRASETI